MVTSNIPSAITSVPPSLVAVPEKVPWACCVPALSVVNPIVIAGSHAAVMPGLATPVTWNETSELAPPSAAWQLYVPPSGSAEAPQIHVDGGARGRRVDLELVDGRAGLPSGEDEGGALRRPVVLPAERAGAGAAGRGRGPAADALPSVLPAGLPPLDPQPASASPKPQATIPIALVVAVADS